MSEQQSVELFDGHKATYRLEIDKDGFPYTLVRIEGLTARHYPRINGTPPSAGSDPMGHPACIFLEGAPCWIV